MRARFAATRPLQLVATLVFTLGLAALLLVVHGVWTPTPREPALPAARPLAPDDGGGEGAIRFLEQRVKRDPEDFVALNQLADRYLLRLRETGNAEYIALASRAAHASLAVVSAEVNSGGLAALTQVELATHNFAAARDDAVRLIELQPEKGYPYQMAGDALLELGDYPKASAMYGELAQRDRGGVASNTRLARLALLQGDPASAQRLLGQALRQALSQLTPSRETVAWCRWQLGEVAFAGGDVDTAERQYRDALTTFPDYVYALAAQGRLRAARGDLDGAISAFEGVVLRLPDPTFVATLGDLYTIAGRVDDAERQYLLVERIGRLTVEGGALYNRQLALFHADHERAADDAYAAAGGEYIVRRDIYGADALAWTALKAGRIAEAQQAMTEALRLGTRDARLFYHAGMIARAAGDTITADDYLKRALTLNPSFDPLQARFARQALGGSAVNIAHQ